MSDDLSSYERILEEAQADYRKWSAKENQLRGEMEEVARRKNEARATMRYVDRIIKERRPTATIAKARRTVHKRSVRPVTNGRARRHPEYPINAKWPEKVRFVIGYLNRFASHGEIRSVLLANEPTINVNTITPVLSSMFKRSRELARIQYSKTPQWTFYGLPRFAEKGENGKLTFADDAHRPSDEALDGVDKSTGDITFNGGLSQIKSQTLFAP